MQSNEKLFGVITTLGTAVRATALTAIAGAVLSSSALAAESDYVYLVHKATGKKASTCGPYNSEVAMADASATDVCAQWELVEVGDYFYLRSVGTDGYVRPRGLSNGIPIKVHETTWTGDYTRWSTTATGDGYFHLVNKQTKKFAYSSGDMFEQESKNWKGDWTRWKFEPVEDDGDNNGGNNGNSCVGADVPSASFTTMGESEEGAADGAISFSFSDDAINGGTRSVIEFSLDGGQSYPYSAEDNTATTTIGGQAPGDYEIWIRWGEGDCATSVGTAKVDAWVDEDPYDGQFGVEGNVIWFLAQPEWPTGGTFYLCRDMEADCYSAEFVDGKWQKEFSNLSGGTAQLKVPGMGADSFPKFEYSGGGSGGSAGGGDGTSAAALPFAILGEKDPNVVAEDRPEDLPLLDYGYDKELGNFLVAGLGVDPFKFGWTLYTYANDIAGSGESACVDCAAWPALLLEEGTALIRPSRMIGDLGTITLPDGSKQVTLNGLPLYMRAADKVPGQLDGISAAWPAAVVKTTPVASNIFQDALQTPSNMPLSNNGFQFNIDGGKVTWAFGGDLDSHSGPTVKMFCSADQTAFHETDLTSGVANIPQECTRAAVYWYYFRYELNNPGGGSFLIDGDESYDPASAYRYTALYVNDGSRIDLGSIGTFKDSGANWMRFRHPRAYDGVTEAVRDASHNFSRLADLARYSIDATETYDTSGRASLVLDFNLPTVNGKEQGLVRVEGMQNGAGDAKLPTWRYQFTPSNGQTTYTVQGDWSYGQNLSFEMTGVVGRITSQTYNTFQYYTFGKGFNSPIGDPRLSLVGKGGTHMVFNIKNHGGEFKNGHTGWGVSDEIMEKHALFTQHLTTIQSPHEVDNWIWGHHLFHGVKLQGSTVAMPSQDNLGSGPGDTGIGAVHPEIKEDISIACGDCHWRDGRGSHILNTPKGVRIAPPTFGTGLLQYVDGREAGFTWKGDVPTVRQQIRNALVADHQIDPDNPEDISKEALELIYKYTEYLTVPARFPGTEDNDQVARGEQLFNSLGCSGCHQPIQKTSSHAPYAWRDLTIRPYSDMKIHQVADGEYRTQPLWGLGRNIMLLENNNRVVNNDVGATVVLKGTHEEQMANHHFTERGLLFLHDGRATSLPDAINAHLNTDGTGEAMEEVSAFNNLSSSDKEALLSFLKSL